MFSHSPFQTEEMQEHRAARQRQRSGKTPHECRANTVEHTRENRRAPTERERAIETSARNHDDGGTQSPGLGWVLTHRSDQIGSHWLTCGSWCLQRESHKNMWLTSAHAAHPNSFTFLFISFPAPLIPPPALNVTGV